MAVKHKTPFGIFTESIGLYFSNFNQFFKYISFPVLGQILGLGIIFTITFFYSQNLPKFLEKYPNLNNANSILLLSLVIIFPGLLIYMKALWEYLVAYGSINSMLDNMLKSGKVYDFEAHKKLVQKRTITFAGLWCIIGIFTVLAVFPPFWIICGVLGVYFVLAFQVFTFEEEKSAAGCLKRSMKLVLKHFGSTFLLLALAGVLTYVFIPQLFMKLLDCLGITSLLANIIKPLFSQLPLIQIPSLGAITDKQLSTIAVQSLIAQVFIQYTLPLRSILWSMWYKELSKNHESERKSTERINKTRPSEKLMKESHKKIGKKTLDKNILKKSEDNG